MIRLPKREIGDIMFAQGKYQEALSYYEQVLAISTDCENPSRFINEIKGLKIKMARAMKAQNIDKSLIYDRTELPLEEIEKL